MPDQDQPKTGFIMDPTVDKLRAEKDTWKTHLMAWWWGLGFLILAVSLVSLAVIIIKGIL